MKISEKLLARVPKQRAFAVGISADDLKGVQMTRELENDILAAINSSSVEEAGWGLFFARHLVQPGIHPEFENRLTEAALKQLQFGDRSTKEGCLSLLILFGRSLSVYRDLMLEALRDNNPIVRKRALTAYLSFSKPKEFAPLEAFETDDYVAEEGMGSHLVYDLRNQALERIEQVIGRSFSKTEKTAVHKDGPVVFWWDWEPFHQWKNRWWRKFTA
jgi:hypothetical protein